MSRGTVYKAVRYIILIVIVAASVYLINRNNGEASEKMASPCSTCSKVNACEMPDAKEFRGDK